MKRYDTFVKWIKSKMPKKKELIVDNDINSLVPELKDIVNQLMTDLNYHNIPAVVFETGRSLKRQKYLLKRGTSRTLKSKHLLGRAVDIVVLDSENKPTWKEKYLYYYLMIGALGVYKYGLRWGGNWRTIKDYPHFYLDKKV